MTTTRLSELLTRTQHVLLDFDGPICNVFAGITATTVATRLTTILTDAALTPPTQITQTDDPFQVLRYTLAHAPELTAQIEAAFRAEEIAAVATAAPTPGATQTIRACHDTDRTVAIVSNNSHDAIHAYLDIHHLTNQIDYISARTPADITRLKPHPHLVTQATHALHAQPTTCVLIGDSLTDIHAAHTAGVPAIGYANKTNKPTRRRQGQTRPDSNPCTTDFTGLNPQHSAVPLLDTRPLRQGQSPARAPLAPINDRRQQTSDHRHTMS